MKFQIKEARERAGFTQTELAARIGVAPNTFCGYENGLHDPKSKLLVKIAAECNTTVDYLLGLSGDPEESIETKKAPAPEGAEAREKGIDDMEDKLRSLLLSLGLMPDGDLTAEDFEFLSHVIALIQAYFKK